MKIEKGKLYYNHQLESVVIAVEDSEDKSGILSNKIAVHCPTKEDWDYIDKKLGIKSGYCNSFNFKRLDGDNYWFGCDSRSCNANLENYHLIRIEEFKNFYPEKGGESNVISDKTNCKDLNIGHKQSSNKLNYELDFEFIKQMAERMQTNKGKYEPYNWKKPIEVHELQQAIFRHVVEVMKGNYEDDGRLMGHLESLSCNAMMLNYQLKDKHP